MSQNQVPTLADLHQSPDVAFKSDQLNQLLAQPPHKSWVKKHPIYKNEYLPIDKVEFLLNRIFQQWRCEVLSYSSMFNSVAVHVRLHYKNPVTGEWTYHDGVGAKDLQLDSGAKASDLTAIKGNAVQLALPIAKTAALKDAADHLGSLFGKDLNRKDTVQFQGFFTGQEEQAKQPETPSTNTTEFDQL